jgi:hypothetical protein
MPVPQAATIGTIWIRFESLQARRLSGRQARHMVGRAWGRKRQEQRQRRKQGGHRQLGSAYLQIGLLELSRVMCTRSRSDLRTRRY